MSGGSGRLRHFIIAGWRAAVASRLLSLIALIGLATGLVAAILMAIVIAGALGQNRFVPAYTRTYLALSILSGPGGAPMVNEQSSGSAGPLIGGRIAAVEAWARLAHEDDIAVRTGGITRKEGVDWADPSLADVMPLPVVRGDLAGTLARPDGAALSEEAARRWFGTDAVLGRRLAVAGRDVTVGAVLATVSPAEADPRPDIVLSALNAGSEQRRLQVEQGGFSIDSRTWFRLRPGSDVAAIEAGMRPLIDTLLPPMMKGQYRMQLARVDRLALDAGLHPGARERLVTGALIAAMVLLIAIANHVNLALARAGRRRKEIGIRKAAGASREQIAAQFLGEAVAATLVAALVAMAASEWLIAPLNAFLDSAATINYPRQPGLVVAIIAGAVFLGLVAGAWPALIVSRLAPAAILRPGAQTLDGGTRLRSLLATVQFAALIGLLIAAGIVYQQRRFAMTEGTRAATDQVLTVAAACPPGFTAEVARLPGIRGTACSGDELFTGQIFALVDIRGRRVPANIVTALPAIFPLYGIKPVAGSLAGLPLQGEGQVRRIVLNEAAVREFGLGRPEAAIGRLIPTPKISGPGQERGSVVAVVPDFQFTSVEIAAKPTIYVDQRPSHGGQVSIRLDGARVPTTLAAIDRLWRATSGGRPIDRRFLSDRVEELYRDLARSTQMLAGFAAVAVLLAGAGMAGIAIATTDRRIKEIGIRKAMGASSAQILALLLRQLTLPALFANVIAWPTAYLMMRHWLDGYAYRIGMPWWLFPMAGAVGLMTAVASIGAQALAAARRRPISALHYE